MIRPITAPTGQRDGWTQDRINAWHATFNAALIATSARQSVDYTYAMMITNQVHGAIPHREDADE